MIRIIHTSDIHLDACFAASRYPSALANRRRQSLREVFQGILQRAKDWPADAVLIAGDLYEHERLTPDTLDFLKTALQAAAPVPVFITPGQHDPATPASPYVMHTWPAHVRVFSEPRWRSHTLEAPGLTIHGFGFNAPELALNPFGALRIPRDKLTHVAVGYGSEIGTLAPGETPLAPFSLGDAIPESLAYLALGRSHTMKVFRDKQSPRAAYPGSPEGHGADESGTRYYLEVEIDEGHVSIRPVPSNKSLYMTHTIDCSEVTSAKQVIEAVRAQAPPGDLARIARITLTGETHPEWTRQLATIRDALAADFEYLDLVDETRVAEDYGLLARDRTSLGSFVKRIGAEIADCADVQRRAMLERAREAGVAAYRGRELPIRGEEGE
ncbi:MAG: DNA repair exonuclease [Candidatus Hydrogenedentes bacterium]|nr:DNA repair exonuclease [Candidatus Hydrogenedentota bacterium]